MPWISTEDVKSKRTQINRLFPKKDGWKISVRRDLHDTVLVTISEGPVPLVEPSNHQPNPYNPVGVDGQATSILRTIAQIALEGRVVAHHDQDYGSIPNFYVHMNVGSWNSPYVVVNRGN
jgi:hypothetical protein